jgi:hypothetical protein
VPDERTAPEGERDRPSESEAPTPDPESPTPAPDASRRKGPIEIQISGSLVRCPYCHGDIKTSAIDWVACSACLARHHKDCWQERGACSTCRGSNYLPAEGARFYREGVGSAPVIQKPRGVGRPVVRPVVAPPRSVRGLAEREQARPSGGTTVLTLVTCLFALVGVAFIALVGLILLFR